MINNWKMGFQSLKYAYGRLSNTIMMVIFFLMGILFYAMGPMLNNAFFGGFMIMCAALMPTQMIYSLSVSNLVQASPAKKKMQTSVPAVFTTGSMMAVYLVNILIHAVVSALSPETDYDAGGAMVMQALTALTLMAYLGVAYKYFMASLVMFFVVYFSVYTGGFAAGVLFEAVNIPFALAAVLGFALIAAGRAAQYWVSLLVYKAPMSKMAQTASLRKELQ